MKTKTAYICSSCKNITSKWQGKCDNCNSWNTIETTNTSKKLNPIKRELPLIESISLTNKPNQSRIKTNIEDLDNLLGGGFMPASVNLISGEPGIGKSTITLQIIHQIAAQNFKTLYISGEESTYQISDRAKRLNLQNSKINLANENNLETIIALIHEHESQFVVIDSIQLIYSEELTSFSGSISQSKFAIEKLVELAKTKNITLVIIGHVTKDGDLAGPRFLEHLVDTVLFFEGDRYQNLRLLRSFKNRFGSTNEIGIFEMTETGLIELHELSSHLISSQKNPQSGVAFSACNEGNRSILIEIQSLVNPTVLSFPRRTAQGFDNNRLQILIATMEKHLRINLSQHDIYLNLTGGLKIFDPALDLSIICAILSSFKHQPLNRSNIFSAEIGLTGELRPSKNLRQKIKESEKLGFKQFFTAKSKEKLTSNKLKIIELSTIQELPQHIFI